MCSKRIRCIILFLCTEFCFYICYLIFQGSKHSLYLLRYHLTQEERLGIPENSKHKEEAWRFIRYYVENASNYIAASGNLPTYLPAYNDDMVNIYCEGSGLDVSYAKKFFDPAVQLTTNKIIGNKGAEYMQIGKEEIEQYFNGEKSLEDTLDSIESRVNEALGK